MIFVKFSSTDYWSIQSLTTSHRFQRRSNVAYRSPTQVNTAQMGEARGEGGGKGAPLNQHPGPVVLHVVSVWRYCRREQQPVLTSRCPPSWSRWCVRKCRWKVRSCCRRSLVAVPTEPFVAALVCIVTSFPVRRRKRSMMRSKVSVISIIEAANIDDVILLPYIIFCDGFEWINKINE